MNEKTIDMTQGSIPKKLMYFAIPVFLSALLQQAYILVDSLIVSKLLGDLALAAVTNCENVAWLITSFIFGLGMGASVLIAQAYGAKDKKWMHRLEGTAYSICFILCLLFFILGPLLSEPIIFLLQTPESVFEASTMYLTIYIAGVGGLILFNMGSAVLQAIGNARIPLYFLIVSTLINISCDWILIQFFHTGVEGAAAATVLAEWITGIALLGYILYGKGVQRIEWKDIRIDKRSFKEILHMGIPGAVESSAVSLANTIIQGFINTFGALAMAATGAFASIEGFAFLPISAFCQALGTFTGQNVGANQKERTIKGCRFALVTMSICALAIGLLMMSFSEPLMHIFSDNPETIAYGITRAHITLWFYPLLGLTHCFSAILRGAGKPLIPMFAYLGSWGVVRVLLLMWLLPSHHEYALLCWVYPITWSLSALGLWIYYQKEAWFPEQRQGVQSLEIEME